MAAKKTDAKALSQKEWLALAKKGSQADLDTLLGSLFEAKMLEVVPRLAALKKRKPDPRVARTLTDALVEPPFASTASKKMWQPLFELLEGVGDAAALARLAPLIDGYDHKIGAVVMGPWMKTKLSALVAALEKRHGPAKKVAASKSESKAGVTAAKKKTGTIESLYDDVLANPDDDDARAVLGDAFEQAGDPRGEFIALQLQRAHGKRGDVARERELLTAHRSTWLGPLFEVIAVDDAVFERGFLAKARVIGHPASKVAKTAGHPSWGTVRELGAGATSPLAVIVHPMMRALRTVTGLNSKAFYTLANHTTPLPIEEVSTRLDALLVKPKANILAALTEASGLPRLKRIHFEYIPTRNATFIPRFDFFWSGALAARLERVTFDAWLVDSWINHLFEIGIEHPKHVVVANNFELSATKPGGRLDALSIRNDSRNDTTIPERVFEVLRSLQPRRVASITCKVARIEQSTEHRAKLAEELKRLRG